MAMAATVEYGSKTVLPPSLHQLGKVYCLVCALNSACNGMQVYLYSHQLQLTRLKVLSTTTSVPTATYGTCPEGSIDSICIGERLNNSSWGPQLCVSANKLITFLGLKCCLHPACA